MIDISLIAQDIINSENTFKASPDTYNRSKFGLLCRVNTSTEHIIVQGGYVTNYFDMTSCKNIGELLKAERKKYVNAANLTGGSMITLKNHSKSLNMYPFTLNLLQ